MTPSAHEVAKKIAKRWVSLQSLNYIGLTNDIESALLQVEKQTREEVIAEAQNISRERKCQKGYENL